MSKVGTGDYAIIGTMLDFLQSPQSVAKVLKALKGMPVSTDAEMYAFFKAFETATRSGGCLGWRHDLPNDDYITVSWRDDYFLEIASQGKHLILATMSDIADQMDIRAKLIWAPGSGPLIVAEKGQITPWSKGTAREREASSDTYSATCTPNDTHTTSDGREFTREDGCANGRSYCLELANLLRKKRTQVKWTYKVPYLLQPKSVAGFLVGGVGLWLYMAWRNKKANLQQ